MRALILRRLGLLEGGASGPIIIGQARQWRRAAVTVRSPASIEPAQEAMANKSASASRGSTLRRPSTGRATMCAAATPTASSCTSGMPEATDAYNFTDIAFAKQCNGCLFLYLRHSLTGSVMIHLTGYSPRAASIISDLGATRLKWKREQRGLGPFPFRRSKASDRYLGAMRATIFVFRGKKFDRHVSRPS
jgi:hypothetical protein